jgi:acyl-CoA synthetase (AMP-forming)/AMP-acid ligase II
VVKVGAVRIDPSVVEDVLRVVPGVRDVRVVPTPVGAGEVRLVAHVALGDGASVTDDDLRAFAAARLTSNAVPARFILHDDPFPLLASGKTDVRELNAHRGGS